jgi:hypothetical protein
VERVDWAELGTKKKTKKSKKAKRGPSEVLVTIVDKLDGLTAGQAKLERQVEDLAFGQSKLSQQQTKLSQQQMKLEVGHTRLEVGLGELKEGVHQMRILDEQRDRRIDAIGERLASIGDEWRHDIHEALEPIHADLGVIKTAVRELVVGQRTLREDHDALDARVTVLERERG